MEGTANASKVGVQIRADFNIDPAFTVFCAEHEVEKDL
jgi:hypothetical protein